MKHLWKLHTFAPILSLVVLASIGRSAVITQTYTGPLPITLTGTLPNQGTVLEQTFTLPASGDLAIFTSSYATGGFQTNLLLFNDMGGFITAGLPAGSPDPTTGLIGDSRLTATNLSAATYTVTLSDFLLNQSATATNLSDGFTANFGNGTTFVDASGNTRTGNYSFTIAPAAAVPEPATLWLAAPVLAWMGIRARRRSAARHKISSDMA